MCSPMWGSDQNVILNPLVGDVVHPRHVQLTPFCQVPILFFPAVPVHIWVLTWAILLTRTRLQHQIVLTILTEPGCHVQVCISASTSSPHIRTVPWPGVILRYTEIYMAEG